MAHYAQIHVSGLDFRYEEHQKALSNLLVKATGIDGRFSVTVLSDASAVVTFPDTPKASGGSSSRNTKFLARVLFFIQVLNLLS